MSGGVIGFIIGDTAVTCSCESVEFAVISTFDSLGVTAFLTNFEIHIRIFIIILL